MRPLFSSAATCSSTISKLPSILPLPKSPSLVSNHSTKGTITRDEARSDGLESQETSAQEQNPESENISSNGSSKATPLSSPFIEKDIKKQFFHCERGTVRTMRRKLSITSSFSSRYDVSIPFFVKSFAVVWSADTIAFFAVYAWRYVSVVITNFFFSYVQLGWLQRAECMLACWPDFVLKRISETE